MMAWLRRHGDWAWGLAILLQPFVLLWWLVPGWSGLTIGNDYPVYAIEHQMELMFSVLNGSWPIYVPGFHHGQSAAAMSLGGLHHPIAWICAAMPGYWQGHALSWNTLFRLVTLGLAHLALWRLLRRFGLPAWLAWVLGTLAIYNLRMLDMFRFAATLEAWTGTWFLVSAVGWLWFQRASRLARGAVVLSTWWLLTSGHPQFAYFGAISAALFVLLLPGLVGASGGVPARRPWAAAWHFWLHCAAWGALGVGLSASLLVPFVLDFMGSNAGRVGREYAWACGYQDTPAGTLANLFLPLQADVHGAFGGSSLLLLLVMLPLARLGGLRLARLVWPLAALVVLVLLYLLGSHSPVHFWAWQVIPFAKSFRVPGRLAQLLPVLLLCVALLAWAAWQRSEGECRVRARRGLGLVAGLAFFGQAVAPWLWSVMAPQHTRLTAQQLQSVPWVYELAIAAVGLVALGSVLLLLWRPRWRFLAVLLVVAVALQTGLVLARGTWLQRQEPTPDWQVMAERKGAELKFYPGQHGAGDGLEQAAVREHARRGFSFQRGIARLCQNPRWVEDGDQAYVLLRDDTPSSDACVIEGQGVDSLPGAAVATGLSVELTSATYNRQMFHTQTPVAAWLLVHHPWDGHWRATVDDTPVEVLRADGLELAIAVPAGSAQVDLWYASAAWRWGMGVSVFSLLVLLGSSSGALTRPWLRWGGGLLAAFLCLGLFVLWQHSLYSGRSLGTQYAWQDGVEHIPKLRPELERQPQRCLSNEGFQVPCGY